MAPNDAGDLINLIPRQGFVEMRAGYESHSTGVGSGDVDLCVQYYDGTTRQLITASSSNIYNSTAAGAATSLGTGFSNGRWDTAIMDGVMAFVNGANTPQQWNGTTLSTLSTTGPTATSLVGVHVFKARSYFWEVNSPSFWYSAVNTLGGTLTEFPLGEVAKKGGKLLRMISWTVDGGAGPDDYAVFIMDTGEVIVYQGDDPGSSLSWGLVGIYEIGRPVNDRAIGKLGGNIVVVTETDIVTLPEAFNTASPPLTKLSTAIADAVSAYGNNDGWEFFVHPNERFLIINVPTATSPDEFEQYVMELSNFAGCRFVDIPARTWGLLDGVAYFGSTDGTVYKYGTTTSDAGSSINCTCVQAWTDFGLSENKMMKAVQPVFEVESNIDLGVGLGVDFIEPTVESPISSSSAGTPWGSSWGSPWGTTTINDNDWYMLFGNGSHLSMTLKFTRSGDQPRWLKTHVLIQGSGNL